LGAVCARVGRVLARIAVARRVARMGIGVHDTRGVGVSGSGFRKAGVCSERRKADQSGRNDLHDNWPAADGIFL
jgi:hypothetical protein